MKPRYYILLLGAALAAVAASVKISDLTLSTSPSTNTFIEIADMNAATKSLKYLLTNLYGPFTNSAGRVQLETQTNIIDLTTIPPGASTRALQFNGVTGSGGWPVLEFTTVNTNDSSYAPAYAFHFNGGTNTDYTYGLTVQNTVHPGSGTIPFDNGGPYEVQLAASFLANNVTPADIQGITMGSRSHANGNASWQYVGAAATSYASNAGATNIGLLAMTMYTDGTLMTPAAGIYAPLVGVVFPDDGTFPNYQSAGLLLDVFTNNIPLIVGRTNNGTVQFSVEKEGSITTGGNTNRWIFGGVTNGAPDVSVDGTHYPLAVLPSPSWTQITPDGTNSVIDLASALAGLAKNFYYSLSTSNYITFSNLVAGAEGTIWVNASGTPQEINFSSSYDNFSTNEIATVFSVTNRAIIAYKVGWGTDATNVMLGIKRK